MNGNQVSWRDYENVDGFGAGTQMEVDELNKALTVGADVNAPVANTPGDGFALRVESLERTLRSVTFKMENLKFWREIPKVPAYNTVEEYNLLHSVGANQDSGFISEGQLPTEDDSTYSREYAVVKFMGTTRRVSHVASVVKPAHGAIIGQETVNGTMHLLRLLERALYYGDSDLQSLQFDGFEKMITDNSPASNILDLRGGTLNADVLSDMCLTVSDAPNYGRITAAHMNPKVHADISKLFFAKERHDTFDDKSGMIGNTIKGFVSPAGEVAFKPNVFLDMGLRGPAAAAIGPAATRPGTPVVSTGPTSPADAASQFGADDVGDYFYRVVAVNQYGRSAPVELVAGPTAVTVASGDKVTFGLTPGGSTDVDFYEIYRTELAGAHGTDKLILRVKNAAGAGEQTINDYNASLPNTTTVFLFQQNLEALCFRQLAPMLRIPLATIDTSVRWSQIIYGTPSLMTPGKVAMIQNVGRSEGYVGGV